MKPAEQEALSMAERYSKRPVADPRYHPLHPAQLHALQERERVLAAWLREFGRADTAALQALELGCGTGGNLLDLLRLGFLPEHLTGLELLPERAALARARLPDATRVLAGDALRAEVADASQDLVLVATVFSSVLNDAVQQQLADALWRWLKPGGALLWLDFVFDNPRNPDVRAVPLTRVRELFPQGRWRAARRVTLAPPIARRLPAALIPVFHALPWLRTHRFAWIEKP